MRNKFVISYFLIFGSCSQNNFILSDNVDIIVPIGVSIERKDIDDSQVVKLITNNFQSITPENAMKMDSIQKEPGKFSYYEADKIVKFAVNNNLRVRGHTLVWHRQLPKWILKNDFDKEMFSNILKDHI